jgi:hypothetical protein
MQVLYSDSRSPEHLVIGQSQSRLHGPSVRTFVLDLVEQLRPRYFTLRRRNASCIRPLQCLGHSLQVSLPRCPLILSALIDRGDAHQGSSVPT